MDGKFTAFYLYKSTKQFQEWRHDEDKNSMKPHFIGVILYL